MQMRRRTYVLISSALAASTGAGAVMFVTDVGHHGIPRGAASPPAIAAPGLPQPQPAGIRGGTQPPATHTPAAAQQQPALAADTRPSSTPAAAQAQSRARAAVQGSGSPAAGGSPAPPSGTPAPPPAATPSPVSLPATVTPPPPDCAASAVTVISVCVSIGG